MYIRSVVFLAMLTFSALQGTAVAASLGIHYGPRSFWAAPIGTNAIALQYEHLNADLSYGGGAIGFGLKTDTGVLTYTHYLDFFGQTASVIGSLPYVSLESELDIGGNEIELFDESGFTDPYVQFYTTLVGGKAQDMQTYVRNEPGFVLGTFAAARIPVGQYDASKPVSPGSNRWEWRLGVPMQYIKGLPTKQTSFEFVPLVYLFGDNDDGFNGSHVSQDPLYQFEAHLTHDLNRMFWGSLNILYAFGGETSTHGVSNDDALGYLGSGLTLGARLSPSYGANVTVGTDLKTKNENAEGNWIRASITKTF